MTIILVGDGCIVFINWLVFDRRGIYRLKDKNPYSTRVKKKILKQSGRHDEQFFNLLNRMSTNWSKDQGEDIMRKAIYKIS